MKSCREDGQGGWCMESLSKAEKGGGGKDWIIHVLQRGGRGVNEVLKWRKVGY